MLSKKTRRQPRSTFNKKMNRKNKYFNNAPNFRELANKYESFACFVQKNSFGKHSINFKDPDAVRELTKCLLLNDFHLSYWDIPKGFLIPTLTSRCNYIHWIHDLLENDLVLHMDDIRGIDIGTGANCIYPLLGHQIYNWKFKASEINQKSIEVARDIISKNNLDNAITIVKQNEGKFIFHGVINSKEELHCFHFSMCNPPFFSLGDEVKHDNPNTDNEYHSGEVYCPGGELQFISQMIHESFYYKDNVFWFTTLIGKKSNYYQIMNLLKENIAIKRVRKTEFYQGKLVRWGLAWSFSNGYEEFQPKNSEIDKFKIKIRLKTRKDTMSREIIGEI